MKSIMTSKEQDILCDDKANFDDDNEKKRKIPACRFQNHFSFLSQT